VFNPSKQVPLHLQYCIPFQISFYKQSTLRVTRNSFKITKTCNLFLIHGFTVFQYSSVTQCLNLFSGDSLSSTIEDVKPPFTVIPIASSLAMSGSAKQFYSINSTADVNDLITNCVADSDEEVTGALTTARKRRKVCKCV